MAINTAYYFQWFVSKTVRLKTHDMLLIVIERIMLHSCIVAFALMLDDFVFVML